MDIGRNVAGEAKRVFSIHQVETIWMRRMGTQSTTRQRKVREKIRIAYSPQLQSELTYANRIMSLPHGRISESAHVVFNTDYFPMREKRKAFGSENHVPKEAIDLHGHQADFNVDERPSRNRTPSAQALRNLAAK